ncbi:metallophosphoesterase [Luteibacter sp. PPL554]
MSMLTWIHIGDLHASDEDDYVSVGHLETIVEAVNQAPEGAVDFVYLPGDNANHATQEQYRRLRPLLDRLNVPFHAIPGDHDFETKSLDTFYTELGMDHLPMAVDVKGYRCLFLDVVSAGTGGPDFRLGDTQWGWLQHELHRSQAAEQPAVVFMHAYPGDLKQGGEAIAHAFADANVAFVDTGHTHYNELLNDGWVIYGATRSTGQIEEDDGRPGYTVIHVDDGVVSWRFRRLGDDRPFVTITQPADHRLVTGRTRHEPLKDGRMTIRAKVLGDDVTAVTASVGGGDAVAMHPVPGEPAVWACAVSVDAQARPLEVVVTATDRQGAVGDDAIRVATHPAEARTGRHGLGTDVHAIEAWPRHGLLGSQLGPNKNGRHW